MENSLPPLSIKDSRTAAATTLGSLEKKRSTGGRYCCLPQCVSASTDMVSLYKIPTTSGKRFGIDTKKWAEQFHQIIFKCRHDRLFQKKVENGLAYICSKHFEDSDIQKNSSRSFIKPGSLPSRNMPVKSHPSKKTPKRRLLEKRLLSKGTTKQKILSVIDVVNAWNASVSCGWRFHQNSESSIHLTYYKVPTIHATPNISLLMTQDGTKLNMSLAFDGTYAPKFSNTLSFGENTLKEMLDFLACLQVCSGYLSVPNKDVWSERRHVQTDDTSISYQRRYFSDDCRIITNGHSAVCSDCMRLHVKCMDNYQRRLKHREETAEIPLSKTAPLSNSSRARLQSTIASNRMEISQLIKELKTCSVAVTSSLEGMIEDFSQKDEFLREWWSVQRRLRKCKNSHGRRYPPSIIKYCLMLYSRSPSAYRFVQKIMILPSARSLCNEKIKTLNNCKTGFQDGVAKRIADAVHSAEHYHQQFAVLLVDEMTIKEDLVFQTSTGQVIGYVDFGHEDINCLSTSSAKVASHMLAVYIRGITNAKLDGVIAFYPTTGASSEDLFLVISRLLLHIPLRTSVTIVGVVFDGLAANRTVMKLLCNEEDDGSTPYRMTNPVDTSNFIYFIPDPPHLLKTTRNNLLNSNKCLWNMGHITMQPIKDLIRSDIARGDMRFYPRFTESHISPTPWEKMNVKLAAQVLSNTIGTALLDTEPALSRFILIMDHWFDCMNAGFQGSRFKPERRPFYSSDDKRLLWLETDFPKYLDDWRASVQSRVLVGDVDRSKMLLTRPTEEGLRAATKSVVAIMKLCFNMGATFVLPRRINQDPLESFFGHQRQKTSRSDAPSVNQFSANARSSESCLSAKIPGSNVQLPA